MLIAGIDAHENDELLVYSSSVRTAASENADKQKLFERWASGVSRDWAKPAV